MVEGSRWIKDLLVQHHSPDFWLASPAWLAQNKELAAEMTALSRPPLTIDEQLFKDLADTTTPSGVLAVVTPPELHWPENPTLLLVFDGLADPGNAGTLLRTAAAAGVEGVLVGPTTVDLTNPKVVRSSMGAVLRLPQRRFEWAQIGEGIDPCRPVAADAAGEHPYTDYDWTRPTALIIGSEAHGLSEGARLAAAQTLAIPLADSTESLNAAAAGAVMLFEAVRQRGLSD